MNERLDELTIVRTDGEVVPAADFPEDSELLTVSQQWREDDIERQVIETETKESNELAYQRAEDAYTERLDAIADKLGNYVLARAALGKRPTREQFGLPPVIEVDPQAELNRHNVEELRRQSFADKVNAIWDDTTLTEAQKTARENELFARTRVEAERRTQFH